MKYVYLLVLNGTPEAIYNTLTEATIARRDYYYDNGEIRTCTLVEIADGSFLLEDI